MKSILSIIYPAQCLGCGEIVAEDAALCPDCWKDTPFILGSCCVKCGAPLLGEAPGDETAECDDCLKTPRNWQSGVSALRYDGIARRLVMALKHGDRQDLVGPFATWMARRIRHDVQATDVFVPVPIHWRRMIKRRFNQSALLANALANRLGAVTVPDALIRTRHTKPQEGLTVAERFSLQSGVLRINPARVSGLEGARVFLVDDVMTSGATLTAATSALKVGGVSQVHTVTLARVVKDF